MQCLFHWQIQDWTDFISLRLELSEMTKGRKRQKLKNGNGKEQTNNECKQYKIKSNKTQ